MLALAGQALMELKSGMVSDAAGAVQARFAEHAASQQAIAERVNELQTATSAVANRQSELSQSIEARVHAALSAVSSRLEARADAVEQQTRSSLEDIVRLLAELEESSERNVVMAGGGQEDLVCTIDCSVEERIRLALVGTPARVEEAARAPIEVFLRTRPPAAPLNTRTKLQQLLELQAIQATRLAQHESTLDTRIRLALRESDHVARAAATDVAQALVADAEKRLGIAVEAACSRATQAANVTATARFEQFGKTIDDRVNSAMRAAQARNATSVAAPAPRPATTSAHQPPPRIDVRPAQQLPPPPVTSGAGQLQTPAAPRLLTKPSDVTQLLSALLALAQQPSPTPAPSC